MTQHRLDSITDESARLADLAAPSNLDCSVPACPLWSLRDLVIHLGEVQRAWARHLKAADPSGSSRRPHESKRLADDSLAAWLRQSTALLTTALLSAGEDTPCWTWWGEPYTSGAVGRHQVHEATIHRFDAEAAVGGPTTPIPVDVAIDAITEFFQIMVDDDTHQPEGQLTLMATDCAATWQTGTAAAPAVTVSATASDLELLLYRRRPLGDTQVSGDAVLAQAFIDAVELE